MGEQITQIKHTDNQQQADDNPYFAHEEKKDQNLSFADRIRNMQKSANNSIIS